MCYLKLELLYTHCQKPIYMIFLTKQWNDLPGDITTGIIVTSSTFSAAVYHLLLYNNLTYVLLTLYCIMMTSNWYHKCQLYIVYCTQLIQHAIELRLPQ